MSKSVSGRDSCGYTGQYRGVYLGKYIADRLFNSRLETHKAALVAIYVLEQAKKHVEYCGGESHVVTIIPTGQVTRIEQDHVNKVLEAFNKFEGITNRLLLESLNIDPHEIKLMSTMADFYEGLPDLQRSIQKTMREFQNFVYGTGAPASGPKLHPAYIPASPEVPEPMPEAPETEKKS